jgi:hypothetical protein
MYDLSICLPGIRNHLWETLYDSATHSIGRYSFEMVIVGPYDPPPSLAARSNFKFIRDFGSPARCAQIGTTVCQGKLMTWASDDGMFVQKALEKAIDLWHQSGDRRNEIIMRYTEGTGYSGRTMPDWYWIPHRHPDLNYPGVKMGWLTAGVGMFDLEYFRELGGWDCRYEHLNMCCHDLSFRCQKDGGTLLPSPTDVMGCDWNPNQGDHVPVYEAFIHNDQALFREMYSQPDDRIRIPYDNWKDSPAVWARRFKDKV